jgi:hypothetical protein
MRIFAAPVASPPAPRVSVAFPVGPQPKLSGVFAPQPDQRGMSAAMAARAERQAERKDTVPESERALAQEIAKAMQPPLMSRLARIQSSFGEPTESRTEHDAPAAGTAPPVPEAAAPTPMSAAMRDLIADDPDAGFSTPPSAAWLGKARRERNRARLNNAIAWVATLVIGGSIVMAAMLMLPR